MIEPVARLVPAQRRARRTPGADRGRFEVPEDFDDPLPDDPLPDDPLPDELQRAFEG